jgi:hypothetical protein
MWNTKELASLRACKEVIEIINICINICTLVVVFDAGISKHERRDAAPRHLIFHETSVIKYTLR